MINMIVAVSKNGVIGKNGVLPWRIPEDLEMFKDLTMGGILYAGKKTASTLPPLAGRKVKILQREGYPSLDTIRAHHVYNTNDDGWIIGGAAIYNASLNMDIIDKIYLSLIDREYEGDTWFDIKKIKEPSWVLIDETIVRQSDPVVKLQEWVR